jgi:E3 ubiquitin-protein ligase RNF14
MMESGEEGLECQEDELVALSSIYDERVFTKSQSGGEVNIYLDIPENFEVKISASKRIETNADETSHDNDAIWNVSAVKYLPPLVLNFSFPPGYPSTQPPQYTMSCKWLNVLQVNIPSKHFNK